MKKQIHFSSGLKSIVFWNMIVAFLLLFSLTSQGQNISNYVFTTSAGNTLENISAGATSLLSGNNDDVATAVTPIGFDFFFGGVRYTHFSANSNGQLLLHTSASSTAISGTALTAYASGTPYLFAMSGDNEVNDGIKYMVVGTAPGSRKFVIEWSQFYVYYTPNLTNAGNMQLWLNESNGAITYVYGEIYNARNATNARGIALSFGNTSTTARYVTVKAAPTSTVSATLTTNTFAAGSGSTTGSPLIANLATSTASARRAFVFTPSPPAAPANLTITAVTSCSMKLNWADNASNEVGYVIYYSTNGSDYSYYATTAANATSYSVSGLTSATNYFWKVYVLREYLGSSVSGTQTTSTLAVSGTNSYCPGATGTLTASSGPGTWSSSNISIATVNATTGLVTGVSAGSATINYTLTATGCTVPTMVSVNFPVISGTLQVCAGATTQLSGSGTPASTNPWVSASPAVATINSNGLVTGLGAGSGTITYTNDAGCSITALVTVIAPSPVLTVSPSVQDICPGIIQTLSASAGNISGSYTVSSGAIGLNITDFSSTGVSHTLNVASIPAGATIDSVVMTINISHTWEEDIEVNLQAPNNSIINLFGDIGSSNDHFINTRISSDNSNPSILSGNAPYSATFKAEALNSNGLIGLPIITTQNFSDLLSIANGNWVLWVYDDDIAVTGTLDNWSLKIYYTENASITWTPVTGLFADANATIPYTGSLNATVYARPEVTTTYTAGAAMAGCSFTAPAVINVYTPSTSGLSSGDYLWSGNNGTDWNSAGNWLTFNGNHFIMAGNIPGSNDNVFIRTNGSCAPHVPTVAFTTAQCKDISVESAKSFKMSGGQTLYVAGNWYVDGSFHAGNGKVIFQSASAQTISAGSNTFNDVVFNNTASGNNDLNITGHSMNIAGTATFMKGIVTFSDPALSLYFGDSAMAVGASESSFVDGKITKSGNDPFVFPSGDVTAAATVFAPLEISAPASVSDQFTCEYFFDASPNNWGSGNMCNYNELDHTSGIEYWDLNRDSGISNPYVTIYWNDAARSGITNPQDLVLAHYENCSGQLKWVSMGGTALYNASGAGSITNTIPFASYSPITIGTKVNSNPLPVSLINFEALCVDSDVEVIWTTATEINNDYFTIEKSSDMHSWDILQVVDGAGNSNHVINYNFTDQYPGEGVKYYRLKQTDFDGTYTYSSAIPSDCQAGAGGDVKVYPNPAQEEIFIDIEMPAAVNVMFFLYDVYGKIIFSKEIEVENAFTYRLPLESFAAGAYQYSVIAGSEIYSGRFVKAGAF